jgi:hypothetical protein
MEEALGAIDVPVEPQTAEEQERSTLRGLVLFESVERDSSSPTEARVAGMMVMDVLDFLARTRPGCADEACARVPDLITRHCPEELPVDDVTALCPTWRLYRERCGGGGS